MFISVFLVRVEWGIFLWVRIRLCWWWELVQDGNELCGGGPRGEGKFLFDDLFGVGFRRVELDMERTTCFLMGGDMRTLNASR
jgi:hypothetical protein